MNITNELMAEILVTIKEIYDIEEHGVNVLWYGKSYGGGLTKGGMNVYEVGFKLKEWAFKKGYRISSYIVSEGDYEVEIKLLTPTGELDKFEISISSDTEVGAISSGCEWILDQ